LTPFSVCTRRDASLSGNSAWVRTLGEWASGWRDLVLGAVLLAVAAVALLDGRPVFVLLHQYRGLAIRPWSESATWEWVEG
jgi:hypothetical protein